MAKDVQQLLLQIDASTELARRELIKMDGAIDRFGTNTDRVLNKADAAFGSFDAAAATAKATIFGFAAGIGIEGVVAFGRAVLSAADDLDAAAEKAGIGVERYQTLKESLRSLEVEGEKVDGIFGRLTNTLGEVQGGTAAAGTLAVLDKMGITARILNGEIDSTDELLDAIAGSAGKFNSEAEFTAAVIDIVGKKFGVDLANALKDGGVALKAGEVAFTEAGGVVSAEYVAKLADANEAVDRFVANSKSKLLIWSAATIGFFDDAISAVNRFEEAEDAAILAAFDRAAGVTPPKTVTAPGSGRAKDDERLRNLEKQGLRGSALYQSYDAEYRAKYGIAPAPAEDAAITVSARRLPRAKASGGARAGARSTARRAPAGPTPQELRMQENYFPQPDFSGSLTDANGKIKPVLEGVLSVSSALDDLNLKAVDLSNVEIIDLASLQAGEAFLQDLSYGFAQAILSGENLGDVLVNALARAGLEAAASGIFSFLTGSGAGGGIGKALGLVGKLFGGFFADGGNPPLGRVSVVGERGPELFVPKVAGTIIPNHALGGGGGNSIYNDLRGAIVESELYDRINAVGARAAQAGALGGRQLAAQDLRRRARQRLG